MRAEKPAIRAAFAAAADQYDAVADIQRRIALTLLAHTPAATRLLDAGCGTGFGARQLRQIHREASIFSLDAALPMCVRSGGEQTTCGDIEALPFAAGSFGLYWSSLAWQWTRPHLAAREAARVLAPGGALRVATLGPRTLHELRQAFGKADHHAHVRDFDSAQLYGEALLAAGFTDCSVDTAIEQAFAPSVTSILRDLRQLGAHELGKERRRSLLGKEAWRRVEAAYEAFRTPAGLPVSYDVIYLSASKA